MDKKTIQFYHKTVFGNELDYVVDVSDAQILTQLLHKKTITSVERELIRDLSAGRIDFEQVMQPQPA